VPRIIREKYENGVLVERQIEGSAFNLRKWVQLTVHSIIAISLAVLAAVAVHDSLAVRNSLSQEETSAANCERSGFRS
jgi:hypothetical protein